MRHVATIAAFAILTAPTLGGDDLSPGCDENVMQIVCDDGRVGFYAFSGGIARFECDAIAENGAIFSLVFITDGTPAGGPIGGLTPSPDHPIIGT